MSIPLANRFWSKVKIGAPDDCWPWTSYVKRGGYGSIILANNKSGIAHRVAWELTHGPIPDGLCVLHTCDVRYPIRDFGSRKCCNPSHLRLGTKGENNTERMLKGRGVHAKGSDHFFAKITDDIVRQIRSTQGKTLMEMARMYGINFGNIWKIRKGIAWKHVK